MPNSDAETHQQRTVSRRSALVAAGAAAGAVALAEPRTALASGGITITTVGPATGNDGAQLRSAISGTADVYLYPGATYTISDSTSWPAFTGKIHGQGATLAFTYSGASAAPPIQSWVGVIVEGVTFTARFTDLSALFGGSCAQLTFTDCGCYDCSTFFCKPISADLTLSRCRFYDSGADAPTTLQQTILLALSGHTVVEDCDFNFQFRGESGALIGINGETYTLGAGASVLIRNNRFFDSPSANEYYSIDAIVDIEPYGNSFDYVEISGNIVYNGSIYMSGSQYLDCHDNYFRYTSNCNSDWYLPFNIYNSNGSATPQTGEIHIHDNQVLCDSVVSSAFSGILKQIAPVDTLRIERNVIQVNASTTNPQPVYTIAGSTAVSLIIIEG
jgi:hypothetical protein